MAQGLAGLLVLFGLAGIVNLSRNPDRTGRILAWSAAALLAVGLATFVIRGDLLHPSGLDDDGSSACGTERVC